MSDLRLDFDLPVTALSHAVTRRHKDPREQVGADVVVKAADTTVSFGWMKIYRNEKYPGEC